MKYIVLLAALCCFSALHAEEKERMLWASINGRTDTGTGIYKSKDNNKVLVSWRRLSDDDKDIAFDLYRSTAKGKKIKINDKPITTTNYQDSKADLNADNTYYLTYSGQKKELDTYTVKASQLSGRLPYVSIPLKSTADLGNALYEANDASVGDLDGDGRYEIVVKRLYKTPKKEEGQSAPPLPQHPTLLEAYRLDGTFLWRVQMGPNILVNNGLSFGVYDFDNDGRCEVTVRTSEGTVFGDGTAIGDIDGDGVIDYRRKGSNYISKGPEFVSVIDGISGRELARTDYISRGTSEEWGDNYFKRASSYRLGVASCDGKNVSIIVGRGCYGKIVVEAWDYNKGKLSKRWRFDTDEPGNEAYEGQGYHNFSTADVDGDGKDEIIYGACTIDHDGKGLNSCGYGHGDALHVGMFDPSRPNLQIWSCFESGSVGAAYRDGATGETIWKYDSSGDVGRCMVADIDPENPGCEMWWYQGNAHSVEGKDLGYNPGSSNMAIWWTGSLNRQLMDGTKIDSPRGEKGRVFSIYRYSVSTNNSSKKNPCFYGDIVGDWREEVIFRSSDNTELRIFSTWFPTDYSFPFLMSDHVYLMSALNQNIGYNQPTHTGFYLGSDLLKK